MGNTETSNGPVEAENDTGNQKTKTTEGRLEPDVVKKLIDARAQVRESFGKVVMAMMMIPRYRQQSLDDLQHLVLDPLINDRIAIASAGNSESNPLADIAGVAIWASVSKEVDQKIRDQIKAGVFPLKLKAEDWKSGKINWLLDVIAPNSKAGTNVVANFHQVVKDGELRFHPLVTRLVDPEILQKMGARKSTEASL